MSLHLHGADKRIPRVSLRVHLLMLLINMIAVVVLVDHRRTAHHSHTASHTLVAVSSSPFSFGGSAVSISLMSSCSKVPVNGGRPARHSYKTQPRAHKSEQLLCTEPERNNSGAIYAGVPLLAAMGACTASQLAPILHPHTYVHVMLFTRCR